MRALHHRQVLAGHALRPAGPQPAHPRADRLDRRVAHRHRRRHATLRDDDQPVGDLEQLVELLADDEQRTAGVAQREQRLADLRRRADVDAPGRLRDDQALRLRVDLAPDDELLQVAALTPKRSISRCASARAAR
jgi:hypothetical protein